MKAPLTLIDRLYRTSFRPEAVNGWKSNSDMRRALEGARRFVVDDPMSAFMAELANEAFIKSVNIKNEGFVATKLSMKILDSLRASARLPHDAIWIEYALHPYQTRSQQLRLVYPIDLSETPDREGWLIQQHPAIDSACIMHLFTSNATDVEGHTAWTFPFAFGWCSDDNPLPWKKIMSERPEQTDVEFNWPSSILAGIKGYERTNVNCVYSPLIQDPDREYEQAYQYLLTEWLGVLRRVWSLLATIDHLPLLKGEVRQSKGFLARGRIRKYLSHQTITLNVPAKRDTRVLARKVIAIAHRKRHEVRGHWRDDWRNPPGKFCNPHLWECLDDSADLIRCNGCNGRQIYIRKHERGDASLGYVTHDYRVTHDTP